MRILQSYSLFGLACALAFVSAFVVLALLDGPAALIGARNINRRRSSAAVVIFGLVIGTSMLSGALIMNDSMDNMIAYETYDRMHLVDETVYFLDPSGAYGFFNSSVKDDLAVALSHSRNFDGITGEIEMSLAAFCPSSGLGVPSVKLIGIDRSSVPSFGGFYEGENEADVAILDGLTTNGNSVSLNVFATRALANTLDAREGYGLTLFMGGQNLSVTIASVIDNRGRANWDEGVNIFVDLARIQDAFGLNGKLNVIKLSNAGGPRDSLAFSHDAEQELKRILNDDNYHPLSLQETKSGAIEDAKEESQLFRELFYVFASFAVIAGELLIVNIFTLIAEERKTEMGMARAIGMKRRSVRRLYTFEGTCYAICASSIGAFAGIPISYAIMLALGTFSDDAGRLVNYFTYSEDSLALAFSAGFITTTCTIALASARISRLNVTMAIRNLAAPKSAKDGARITALGFFSLVSGLGLLYAGVRSAELALATLGQFMTITGASFACSRFVGKRAAFTFAGLANLIIWYLPIGLFDYVVRMEMFVLSGVLGIASLLLVLIPNLEWTLDVLSRANRGTRRAILTKYSVLQITSYKSRASLSIAVFSLVIFTITVMNIVVSVLSSGIATEVDRQSAGYELVGTTSPATPVADISGELSSVGLDDEFSSVLSFYLGEALVGHTSAHEDSASCIQSYAVLAFDEEFAYSGKFALRARDGNYSSDRAAFDAMRDDPSLIIVDRTVVPSGVIQYVSTFTASVGDEIEMVVNGTRMQKRIIGILDEFIVQGIFVWRSSLGSSPEFNLSSAFMFDMEDGRENKEELARELERKMLDHSLEVIIIKDEVDKLMSMLHRHFRLYSAFMALGLVIGICGLATITMRAVRERKKEIGILRAIGLKRRIVVATFAIEASFIVLLGLGIGTLHGIFIARYLWREEFAIEGFPFVVQFANLAAIDAFALAATFIGALIPAREAGKVSPSVAMRSSD